MRKNIFDYLYQRLIALYNKSRIRFSKSLWSGRFRELGHRRQYRILRRLERMKARLTRFENKFQHGGVALAITGLSFSSSVAQEVKPVGEEFRVNTHTMGAQRYQKIAIARNGDFVVTWASRGQDDPTEYGIYAQRYNAAGQPAAAEFRVNTHMQGRQTQPAIAMDGHGNFVIVWTSHGQDGHQGGVFGQRFDASGMALGNEFQVNIYTDGNQYSPSVAMDSDGDFVVAWSCPQDTRYGIFARRYNASGEALGGEQHVNTRVDGIQRFSAVAMDDDGDFVVTWQSDNQDGSSYGIYGQRYNASGVKQGAEFQVNTYTRGQQKATDVAMDSDGDFVVVWQSLQDGDGDGIYAQRYNALGEPIGSEFLVNTRIEGSQDAPSVHMNSAGDFLIAWNSAALDNNSGGVSARRYNSTGEPEGAEFLVNTYTAGSQFSPSVAIADNKNFVIAWTSEGQDGGGHGIYAQRYTINHPPEDIDPSDLEVDENVSAGTVIAILSAIDPDENEEFTYLLTEGAGDDDNEAFFIEDDRLLIREAPDFEIKDRYSIRLRVVDEGGLSLEKVFIITVVDLVETGLNYTLKAFGESTRLYPNPARESARIDLEGDVQIRIMDLAGNVLKRQRISNRIISVEGLPSGTYLLEFTQNERTGIKKLILE